MDTAKNKFARKDFIAKNKEAVGNGNVKRFKYDEEDVKERRPSYRRRSRSDSSDTERFLKSSSLYDFDTRQLKRYDTDATDVELEEDDEEIDAIGGRTSMDLDAGKLAVLLR